MPKLRLVKPLATPTEAEEMETVAAYLDWLGVLWMHPSSEGKRSWAAAKQLKRQGLLRAGYPDIVIFTQPPALMSKRGVMIELKRQHPRGRVTPEQMRYLERACEEGYAAEVCWGAEDAIRFLHVCGWGNR